MSRAMCSLRTAAFLGTFALLTSFLTCLSPPARAEQLASPSCGTQNLLAGKLPSAQQDVSRNLRLVTDEQAAPEGAQWDAPPAITFDTAAGSITYDLGQVTPVSSFTLQADANDTYKIWGSLDGAPDSFKLLIEVDNVVGTMGHGLRTRPVTIGTTMVRFLRVGEPVGDGFFSISEFEAFCQAPSPFPPHLKIIDAPAAKVVEPGFWSFAWWENDASSRVEMAIAFAALALVGWGLWLAKKGFPERFRKTRAGMLIVVGALSFCAYWNFFSFHFSGYFHVWDTFHYYIGSKYFKEMSYDRLYECVAVADWEDPSLRRRVELRKIMDLRTNMMTSTDDILKHPDACKSHFTPERWDAFKHDVAYFRALHGVKRWEEAQTDHGYNATPVWNIVGSALANLGPASDSLIRNGLILIDPLFILGLCVMTWWAFGWRVLCVALAVFATDFPCRFYWTGGAFLRWDWLFYFVGGVCLVRKDKYFVGGIFLGYSSLLRVFPSFCLVGPALVIIQQLLGRRPPRVEGAPWWRAIVDELKPEPFANARELFARIDRRWLRFFGGIALTFAVLVPISLVTSNGVASYREFLKNSEKHNKTPLTNYMGLKTVTIYRPSEAGHFLKNDKLEDPWGHWKQVKLKTAERSRPLLIVCQLAFVALLWMALRGVEPWVALSMGTMMMAVMFELTCYYYSFMFVVAFLYEKKKEAGALLLAATAATGFIDWAPTKYLPSSRLWDNLRMSQWLDEQYTWMSLAIIAAFVWILYRFAFPEPQAEPAGAGGPTPVDDADDGDADAPAARKGPRRGKRGGAKSGASGGKRPK
jgi:hypothetical protein